MCSVLNLNLLEEDDRRERKPLRQSAQWRTEKNFVLGGIVVCMVQIANIKLLMFILAFMVI